MSWWRRALEECGALSKIEDLQQDESEDIYIRAVRILEKWVVWECMFLSIVNDKTYNGVSPVL